MTCLLDLLFILTYTEKIGIQASATVNHVLDRTGEFEKFQSRPRHDRIVERWHSLGTYCIAGSEKVGMPA